MGDYTEGKERFRDIVIAYIIGIQNEMIDKEGEGYSALQRLLDLIESRHGSMYEDFRG